MSPSAKRTARTCLKVIGAILDIPIRIIVMLLDLTLKMGLGIAVVLIVWLPFGLFGGFSMRPWAIAGVILGTLLMGLWDCCDIFGLNSICEWTEKFAHRLDETSNNETSCEKIADSEVDDATNS